MSSNYQRETEIVDWAWLEAASDFKFRNYLNRPLRITEYIPCYNWFSGDVNLGGRGHPLIPSIQSRGSVCVFVAIVQYHAHPTDLSAKYHGTLLAKFLSEDGIFFYVDENAIMRAGGFQIFFMDRFIRL